MKKKFFFLFVVMFAFCGVFGFGNLQFSHADASSSDASVWDGEFATSVSPSDFYNVGSQEYYIRSAKGFSYFVSSINNENGYRSYAGSRIYLETDIDLKNFNWKPIAKIGQEFEGIFDGQGHYIYNLNISSLNENTAGLFGAIKGNGSISNLHLRNVNINLNVEDDEVFVGGLVGSVNTTMLGTSIQRSSVKGQIVTTSETATQNVGGLVGSFVGNTVSRVYTDVKLKVSGNASSNVGGLVGKFNGKLSESYAEGQLEIEDGYLGGLVGQANNSNLVDVFSKSLISKVGNGGARIGGLVGQTNGTFSLNNAYNAGDIVCDDLAQDCYFAGLVGFLQSNENSLSNSFSIGKLTSNGNVDELFNSSSYAKPNTLYGSSFKNIAQLARTKDFYLNSSYWTKTWDVSSVWDVTVGVNESLPHLRRTHNLGTANSDKDFTGIIGEDGNKKLRGQGTKNSPYLIETAGDLAFLASMESFVFDLEDNVVGAYFSLQSDIDLAGKIWKPIGENVPFQGVFDGNGHTISGLTCSYLSYFTYHGLFAQTANAVIKNLKVGDVRFLNDGNNGVNGNLIGFVSDDTYLINCVDSSMTDSQFSVGAIDEDAQLFVISGKNNVNLKYEILKHINFPHVSTNKVVMGYEFTISGNGGNFYDANKELYAGEYRVLVKENDDETETRLQPILQDIDKSYGSTIFPELSTSLGEKDVLIKRGFKLRNYVYSTKEEILQLDNAKAIVGLEAVWNSGDSQKVRVIFNQYEKDNFAAQDFAGEYIGRNLITGETVQKDENGLIYVDYMLEYDSFVNESVNQRIFEIPVYIKDGLQFNLRDNFEIANIYSEYDFANHDFVFDSVQSKENSEYVNDNLKLLYVEWKGQETEGSTITLRLINENANFEVEEAIKGLAFKQTYDADNFKISDFDLSNLQKNEDGSVEATFNYSTLISSKFSNFANFELNLFEGYGFAGQLELTYPNENGNILRNGILDTNFGVLTASKQRQVGTNDFNNVLFYNLEGGSYTIDIKIERQSVSNNMFVSDDVYFGISPKINFQVNFDELTNTYSSNVYINKDNSGEFVDIFTLGSFDETFKANLYAQMQSDRENMYVAFDVVKNQIIFSTKDYKNAFYGGFGDFSNEISGSNSYIRFGDENNGRTFIIKKFKVNENDKTLNKIRMFETLDNLSSQEKDLIVELTLDENQQYLSMQYMQRSSFVFLMSTGNDDTALHIENAITRLLDENENPIGLIRNLDLREGKRMSVFSDIVVDKEKQLSFSALTSYTKAMFFFNLKMKDDSSLDSKYLPKVLKVKDDGVYDVSSNGTIEFWFEESDYYKFLLDENNLFNGIKISVNMTGSTDDYESRFNAEQSGFFENAQVIKFDKFENLNNLEFLNQFGSDFVMTSDIYKVTLPYLNQEISGSNYKLRNGRYTVNLLFEFRDYVIQIENKFVDYQDVYINGRLNTNLFGLDILKDDETSGIVSEALVNDVPEASLSNLRFDDKIQLTTELGDKKGYRFERWMFVGENGMFLDAASVQNFKLNEKYFRTGKDCEFERFTLKAFAVYVKKEVKLKLAEVGKDAKVIVKDRFGGQNVKNAAGLGLKVNFKIGDNIISNMNEVYTYVFSSQFNAEEAKLGIQLSGNNSSGYYICGFQAVNAGGKNIDFNDVNEEADKLSYEISLSGLHALLADGSLDNLTQNVYIRAIVGTKSAKVVFHSGTGDAENQYGDKFGGTIYDINGFETTDTTYTIDELFYGETRYLDNLNVGENLTVDALFASRIGYYKGSANYWGWKNEAEEGSISNSRLDFGAKFFKGIEGKKGEVHFYRIWTPLEYRLNFRANGGTFNQSENAEIDSVVIKFNSYYSSIQVPTLNDVHKNGYSLVGFKISGQENIVFNQNGEFQHMGRGDVFNEQGLFIKPCSVDLQAVWVANQYNVLFDFNSGSFGEETQLKFLLTYDQDFSSILNELGALKDFEALRLGFKFDAFYAIGDGVQQKILQNTKFNESISSFEFKDNEDEPVLTLYAGWNFDKEFLQLSLSQSSLENLSYNSRTRTIFISEYFADENIAKNNNFEIIRDEGNKATFDVRLPKGMSATLNKILTSEGDATIIENGFTVMNAGYYSVKLDLQLQDNAEFLNLGIFKTFSFILSINVEQAELSISEEYGHAYYVQNTKRLLMPFMSQENANILNAAFDFNTVVNVLRTLEGADNFLNEQGEPLSLEEIYEYIIVKYYLLITNNDAQSVEFKKWRYRDFVDYSKSESAKVQTILNDMKFYGFYNHSEEGNRLILNEYATTTELISQEVIDAGGTVGVQISKVEVLSSSGIKLQPHNRYTLRFYLHPSENNINYKLSYNVEGQAYVEVDSAYLLPEILNVKNLLKEKSVYFSDSFVSRQFEWIANENPKENFRGDGRTYYELEEGIFFAGDLYTSGKGNGKTDTVYKAIDEQNFIYFDNVSILKTSEIGLINVTENFKLVLAKDEKFTILGIEDVALISVASKYLTTKNGTTVLETISDSSVVLSVAEVRYVFDGVEKVLNKENGLPQGSGVFSETDGTVIFQIDKNNSNEVSIFVNLPVSQVTFSTSSRSFGEYAMLYKWNEGEIYDVDGTMSLNDSLIVNRQKIESNLDNDGLNEIKYNAVYTDLVKINYLLNFPDSYVSTANKNATLKLGESTIDDVVWPVENGFGTCTSLKILDGTNQLELQEMFGGDGGVFDGISSNKFAPISLNAKWSVDINLEYTQFITNQKLAVASFEKLTSQDVVYFRNLNEEMFDYIYEWFKMNEEGQYISISNTQTLELPEHGSANESGAYKLVVTAKLKEEFLPALEQPNNDRTNKEFEFTLEFVKHKVVSVTLPENKDVIFDNKEHVNDLRIQIAYYKYENSLGDYSTTLTQSEFGFASNSFVDMQVSYEGEKVSNIVNAGQYNVNIVLESGKFDISELGENAFNFVFNVHSRVVDLADFALQGSKTFNSLEPSLERTIFVEGVETFNILLTRQKGEALGNYELYFEDILQDFKKNYTFKMGNAVLFDEGKKTAECEHVSVGNFQILSSGVLRLSYDLTNDLSMVISGEYSSAYTVELTKDFKLIIKHNGSVYKEIQLKLYDVSSGLDVDSAEILQILSENNDIIAKFFNSQTLNEALDVGKYTYQFDVGEMFSQYYASVEMSQDFQFEITPKIIPVSQMNIQKVYDGQVTIFVRLSDGSQINPDEEEVYIEATFANAHVSESVRVDLSLRSNDSAIKLSNFKLQETFTYGKILKRKANLTLTLNQSSFVYGDVSISNITNIGSLVQIVSVLDENNEDVEDLLVWGYYDISLQLNADAQTNANGFLRKGNYKLSPEFTFQDFDMSVNELFFEVTEKIVEVNIPRNFVTITVLDEIKSSYQDTITIAETGEILTLEYSVVGANVGDRLTQGNYNFELKTSSYCNESVIVVINEDNQGLQVVLATSTLYLNIEDEDILKVEYKSSDFEISVDKANKKLLVSNGGITRESLFSFYQKEEDENIPVASDAFDFVNIKIANGNTTTFKNVGKYTLTLTATSNQYSNIVFAKEYSFEITPITINVTEISFVKPYDMQSSFTLRDFDGKLDGDDIIIEGRYDSPEVGANKVVTLSLQGGDLSNYVLSSNRTSGEITKAEASISISKTNYIYGELSRENEFKFKVMAGAKQLPETQFKIEFDVQNHIYSNAGFLEVGTYTLQVSAQSANYQIETLNQSIVIRPFELSLFFVKNGEITAEYGSSQANETTISYLAYAEETRENFDVLLTREEGSQMGYYHILTGESQNKNYILNSVTDASLQGAFRITKRSERVFVLFEDGSVAKDIFYDGSEYDTISLDEENGKYKLVLSNSSIPMQRFEISLGFFKLTENGYESFEDGFTVGGLMSTLQFLNVDSIKNEGVYSIYATNTSSTTHDVKFGKDGERYCFTLNVVRKTLTFKESLISQPFNNKDAVYVYEDASELLEGLIEGDSLSIKIEFFDNAGNAVKYVGMRYKVKVTLEGENKNNYKIEGVDENGFVGGVSGSIVEAELRLIINTHRYVYGQKINLLYSYETEVDFNLEEYINAGRDWDVRLSIPSLSENLSTTGNLKVGEYSISAYFNASDFIVIGYLVDNKEQDRCVAKVIVGKQTLQLHENELSFRQIFTKTYDGTDAVKIKDENGQYLFRVSGIISGNEKIDDVYIANARYEQTTHGSPLKINFELQGEDSENYAINEVTNGEILPVVIDLIFNYDHDTIKSNVELDGREQISQIAYSFNSNEYLTSNSYKSETANIRNFPLSLSGLKGHKFSFWTMNFEILNDEQKNELEKLIRTLKLENVGDENLYKIKVSNDSKTVKFLDALLSDEKDLFGLYFKNSPNIIFEPNWETDKHSVKVSIADEKGNVVSGVGYFYVGNATDKLENYENKEVEFGSTLIFRTFVNPHCFYYGFYVNGEAITSNNNETITTDGKNMTLTLNNVEKDYDIVIRYEIQKVNIIVDLSGLENVNIVVGNFVSQGNGKYLWETNYVSCNALNLSLLPQITKNGYDLKEFNIGHNVIKESELETRTFGEFLDDGVSRKVELTFVPNFEPIDVLVTLNYGFDDMSEVLQIEFDNAYNSAENWKENISREGYDFVGWFNGTEQVVGTDILRISTEHTLLAKWAVQSFKVVLTSPFASITNSNYVFNRVENTYTIETIDFASQLIFTVSPSQGWSLVEDWGNELFEVVLNEDGTATVTLVVPAQNVEFTIPTIANLNQVTLNGQNIESYIAWNMTDDEEIEIDVNTFKIATGKKVKVVAKATSGYSIVNEIIDDEENLNISKSFGLDGSRILEIEGIKKGCSIVFQTEESLNDISIEFSEDSVVETLMVGGISYTSFDELPTFTVRTNSSLSFYVKYKHGYKFFDYTTNDGFILTEQFINDGDFAGYYMFELSNVSQSGEVLIESTFAKFTITMQVVSWDKDEQITVLGNQAFVNGQTSFEADFMSNVELTIRKAALYNFAGWSLDGTSTFAHDETYSYQVLNDVTIYAIFSTSEYIINLGTLNFYELFKEYGDERTQVVFEEMQGGQYFDENGLSITSFQMFHGANKTIRFQLPKGFMYYGCGFYNSNNEFVYIEKEMKQGEEVSISISSSSFDEMSTYKIYMVVTAFSTLFKVESKIQVDEVVNDDNHVGQIELISQNGESVNAYGYIEGTRVHLQNVGTSKQSIEFIAYTADKAYIKVSTLREGYRFVGIEIDDEEIKFVKLKDEGFVVYEISNIVGSRNKVVNIEMKFKPLVNVVDISFTNNDNAVDGGAITIESKNQGQVWTSGSDYASLQVSAYTDSEFVVNAFIKAGYFIDLEKLNFYGETHIIKEGSVRYRSLSIEQTGFVGVLSFEVVGYLGCQQISIELLSSTYTVVLKDNETVLAKIHNVEFNSHLDLSYQNAKNIEIIENRLIYAGGKLNVVFKQLRYSFEGYFTNQNGAGVQYINSTGESAKVWSENGYSLNLLNNRYEYSDNTEINYLGEMEISIYLYMSFQKTRIRFEFEPQIGSTITAKDLLTGVDDSNSWFYNSSPMYIEVSYNTDIYFVAPEIEGYKFYKFVISQRTADGTWITDATSYFDKTPWSTNELDNVVELIVRIVYFVKIDVRTLGGEGTYTITQNGDAQAKALNKQGFVDTSVSFTIEATENKGFKFLRWVNMTTGQTSLSRSYTTIANKRLTLVMNLKGEEVTLDFSEYDAVHGQILQLNALSLDNSRASYLLGRFEGKDFQKLLKQVKVKVGDEITLILSVNYGFAVEWNRSDIEFANYAGNRYYFTMNISSDFANNTLEIIPTFKDEILSIFFTQDFAETEKEGNPIDGNNVVMAGVLKNAQGKTVTNMTSSHGENIEVFVANNARYEISNVIVSNYNQTFEGLQEFYNNGQILLSSEFLRENSIVGTIHVKVEYKRKHWDKKQLGVFTLEGEGTKKNPYQIHNAEELALMMKLVNSGEFSSNGVRYKDSAYILMNDIDLSDAFWTPIGTYKELFNGQFNFNQHKVTGINNAYIFNPIYYNGLFGRIGKNAVFLESATSNWWIYLIVAIVVIIVAIIIISLFVSFNRKKRREQMARK